MLKSPAPTPKAASQFMKRRNLPTLSSAQNKVPGTTRKWSMKILTRLGHAESGARPNAVAAPAAMRVPAIPMKSPNQSRTPNPRRRIAARLQAHSPTNKKTGPRNSSGRCPRITIRSGSSAVMLLSYSSDKLNTGPPEHAAKCEWVGVQNCSQPDRSTSGADKFFARENGFDGG